MPPPRKDHIELICSISELTGLFRKTSSLDGFLQNAVGIIAWHMRAAVCSVYLFDETTGELVLRANQGLNPEQVGRLRMKLDEGLVGKALRELRPVREGNAPQSPFFKLVPGLQEEGYRAFLAVPMRRGLDRLGVLVIQDPVEGYFDEKDERTLVAIAGQISNCVEQANLLMGLREPEAAPAPAELKFGRYTGGAPGFACGRATVVAAEAEPAAGGGPASPDDFRRAVARTAEQIEELQQHMSERMADVASLIFSAHLLILKDEQFVGRMEERMARGRPPEEAVREVVHQYVEWFGRSRNPRLREKVQDVRDLGRRLLRNLRPAEEGTEADYGGGIAVAADLLPSDLVKLTAQNIGGVVLVGGGVTAHIAILARALGLPLVLADERRYLELTGRETVLLDGDQGTVYVDPPPEIVQRYQDLAESRRQAAGVAAGEDGRTATRDGTGVEILANINLLGEVDEAVRLQAAGIGLYRSEFPFIVRSDFPSEEEQQLIYRAIADKMGDRPVTYRTLDVGGDKMLSYFPTVTEANPFLGLRALRFTLRHRDIFAPQVKALLRAGAGRELHVMFPMVSSLDEFLEAKGVVVECIRELAELGLPHNPAPRLGIMIELPSAVEIADELAAASDFLSIGANDLVQYMLAVDRTSRHLSALYVYHHPAVLRALKRIADAAGRHAKPLSICGDMAADVRMVPFLLGIGIRRLSVEVRALVRVRETVRRTDLREAEGLAARALEQGTVREAARVLGIVEETERT